MFLFLFLSSRSMMKCCVLGGSSSRLGIVLLSPHSQAPGPGHAAAMRHSGGLPLLPSFLYQGFLLLWTGAAGIHQQLGADWRGSTPSSSFSCSSSPPTSLLKTTQTHTVPHARLASLDAYPWFLLVCFVRLFDSFSCWRIAPRVPPFILKQSGVSELRQRYLFARCKCECDRQIATFISADTACDVALCRTSGKFQILSLCRGNVKNVGWNSHNARPKDTFWKQEATNGLQQREWERRQEVKRLSDSNT